LWYAVVIEKKYRQRHQNLRKACLFSICFDRYLLKKARVK